MATNLAHLLTRVNGASFITIDSKKTEELLGGRSNPMKNRITKVTTGTNVVVFQNKIQNGYENMVNRRLIEEGKDPDSFQLGPRTWGTRIENFPLVHHEGKDKYYLEVIVLRESDVQYFIDGDTPIDPEDIEGFKTPKVYEDSQGGLERKVKVRTYGLDTLTALRFNGEEHTDMYVDWNEEA
jgi:hypothetical protein